MSKIKVGDKVIVLDVNYPISVYGIEVGEEVEVEVAESDYFKYIGVRNDNAKFQIISPEQVELVVPKYEVGDKVRILNTNNPVQVCSIEVNDVVKITEIDGLGYITFLNNSGFPQVISKKQIELVSGKVSSKFKVGDKVRLNTNKTTRDYYGIIKEMINDFDTLTIESIKYNSEYDELITVHENCYKYHPSWLELVEGKEELEVEKVEEIGYTIITGYHFGSPHKYSWLCDRELYNNIKLNDLVLVETKLGEQVVQVVKKSEVLDRKSIHKEVIKKLEITSK